MISGRQSTVGVIAVDHGSAVAAANAATEALVTALARSLPDVIVEPAHMELAAPTVADAYAACVARGATEIVVLPLFVTPGKHLSHDIPALLTDAARVAERDVPWRLLPPLADSAAFLEMLAVRLRHELGHRAQ